MLHFLNKRRWFSLNHGPRPDGKTPSMIVLHYTGMQTAEVALERLCDPASEVSAHYLIEESGMLHNLVPEDRRAWHAGLSYWAGERDINGVSIGIELVNPGHEFGYRPFPEAQITSLIRVCQGLMKRYEIPPSRVLGHSDVAPGRKTDPGELFPWELLAQHGVGVWPAPVPAVKEALVAYGYNPDTEESILVREYKRHFYPEDFSG